LGISIALLYFQRIKEKTPGERAMKGRILIADDEESIRFTFREILQEAGYDVAVASNISNCIKKMQEGSFDLLLLDITFGVDNGLESIQALKTLQPNCQIVIITGNPRLQSLVDAQKQGAVDYLTKPVRQASLLYNVQKALANQAPPESPLQNSH
jgi:two-component system nitrogen regulation response regulator NtrX